jgi:hypothetical protein
MNSGKPYSFEHWQLDAEGSVNTGSRRKVAVFQKADGLTNPRQRNIVLLTIGHGATNTSAAFLTTRDHITRHATMAGIGRPLNSVARGNPVVVAAVAIGARRTNFGKPYSFQYWQLQAEYSTSMQVRRQKVLSSERRAPWQTPTRETLPSSRLVMER